MKRALIAVTASALLATLFLAGASGGHARTATIGSPLTNPDLVPTVFGDTLLVQQTVLPGADMTAPYDGRIVSWSIIAASGGPMYLRAIDPMAGNTFIGRATEASGPITSTGKLTFAAKMPISAGDFIGVQNTADSDELGVTGSTPGANYNFFLPPLATGGTPTSPSGTQSRELGLQATVVANCTAPAVTGKKLGAANTALADADCEIVVVKRPKNKQARKKAKFVRKQVPAAGKTVPGGDPVTLTLGRKPKKK